MRFVNKGFAATLVVLVVSSELVLRWVPSGPPRPFRLLYGNALSMYMAVAERLRAAAPELRFLAMGDSLAMTQFRPDVFAAELGVPPPSVFNAGYPGMGFPSQERMLRWVDVSRLSRLELALYFVNPLRFDEALEANNDVFRVGIPAPEGPWREMASRKQVGPLLDYSRLYGLSLNLVRNAWRFALWENPVWDDVALLGPRGGVAWGPGRADPAAPEYPYARIRQISEARAEEARRVVELLRSTGARVAVVPSAMHPGIDLFESDAVRERYREMVVELVAATGSDHLPDALAGFSPPADTDFCDYGHMNRSGGAALTSWLGKRLLEAGLAPRP